MKSFLLFLSAMCLFGCEAHSGDLKSMESAEKEWNKKASQQLLAYMSLETMFPDKNVRALAEAAGKGKVKKVDKLVSNGVDVNSHGAKKATPLFWAMRSDSIDGFKKLLELGADSNIVFDDGGTVIHWAVQFNNSDFLKQALEHGGNPNLVAGQLGQTPLFKAVGSSGDSDIAVLRILFEHGANPNVKESKGNTPAMIAAGVGRFDIVYVLLDSGADYSLKNDRGYSLLDRIASKRKAFVSGSAQEKDLEKVIVWLSERNVDIP